MEKLVILQPKQEGREDSLFYEGEIARGRAASGRVYTLIAAGDIRVSFLKHVIDEEWEEYRNGNILEAVERYSLTDKLLRQMEMDETMKWENNNWFEVCWETSKGMEYDLGVVEFNYSSAIKLLKRYIDTDKER